MFSQNPKLQQEKELHKLAQSLPDNLPAPSNQLVELATNYKKLKQLRQKCATTNNPTDLARMQQSEKKYALMTLSSYKANFMELDRMHTRCIVDLKLLLQKVEKLEKFRAQCANLT